MAVVNGTAGNDSLYGGAGTDTLNGGDGNDWLDGAGGADVLNGGNGYDIASYDSSTTGVVIDLDGGSHSTGDAAGDVYLDIERYYGSFYNDTFIAGATATAFQGGRNGQGGDDVVDYSHSTSGITLTLNMGSYMTGTGVGGYAEGDAYTDIDRFIGTTYDDTYIVNGSLGGVVFTEAAGGGNDTIKTDRAGYTLDANIENLTYIGTGNFAGTGNGLANVLTGGSGADTLVGGAGADTLVGGTGYDIASYDSSTTGVVIDLDGGSHSTGDAAGDVYLDIERYYGSFYNDTFIAGATASSFDGGRRGQGGDDVVDYSHSTSGITLTISLGGSYMTGSGAGGFAAGDSYVQIDRFVGSAYDDTYILNGALSPLTITEAFNGGTDTIKVDRASYTLGANIENLTFIGTGSFTGTGNSLNNILIGGSGKDTLSGLDGNDTLIGSGGADVLNGGNGSDTASYMTAGAAISLNFKTNIYTGDAAGDTFSAIESWAGSNYNDTFVSGNTSDAFDGAGGFDTIDYSTSGAGINVDLTAGTGSGGDAAGDSFVNIEQVIGSGYADTLASAHAGDSLVGGTGDDVFVVGNGGVLINENVGEGVDEIRTTLSSLSLSSYANVERLAYIGSGNFSGTGDSGNNTITGGSGDDTLAGGAGADMLNGGNGTDAADYSTSSAPVTVDLTAGTASGGDATGDSFVSVEAVIGSAYADTLSSATAGHILAGAAGDDIYFVGSSGITIVEAVGGGTDEVQTALSSLSIAAFANVENLTYSGTGNFVGTGNAGDNILTGGAGNDTLIGGGGADRLIGGNGTDTASYSTATSGVTIDLKTGVNPGDAAGDVYNGVERFQGSSFNDTFISSSAAETFDGAGGTDTVSYAGSAGAVAANLTTGIASGGDATGDSLISIEKVIGSGFADTLSASSSGKTLIGGGGDDIYVVGANGVTITEGVSGGTDTVQTGLTSLSIASFANVENLTYTGSGSFTGSGNAGDNILTGGAGNDVLTGGAGADELIGGGGLDTASYATASTGVTIDLKTGINTGDAAGDTFSSIEVFRGSTHNDTFIASAASEAFDGNGGSDIVSYARSTAAVTVDLTAGTGGGGDAAGDGYSNVQHVVGSDFADTLASSTAGHILEGGAGNDLYLVGDGGVVVTELAGGGVDELQTVLSSFSIAGYANVENLTYVGSIGFVGIGNDGDNVLTGGAGDDTLTGGVGADQLNGGAGTDTADYSTSTAAISVDLSTGWGSGGDAAGDSLSGIERAVGSAFDDTLSASGVAETLEGGAGNDTITIADGVALGGDGDDMLIGNNPLSQMFGGNGADQIVLPFGGQAFGGEGDDTYHLENMSGGTAIIRDDGTSALDKVLLPFLSSTSFTQTQVGDDLYLSDGTTTVDLQGWFAGYNTIEQFQTTDADQFSL